VVDALALQAFFQRVAFEFVIPRIQGIGGNIGCHERTLLQAFCMMRGRSDNLIHGQGEGATMLVTFTSSETGELMMFADVAGALLRAVGKETTKTGTFTRDEMLPAAELLRAAVARGEAAGSPAAENDEAGEAPVTLGPRAWPLIDMLERSSKGGAKANIVWKAAADF
jgi:hypothetical protein